MASKIEEIIEEIEDYIESKTEEATEAKIMAESIQNEIDEALKKIGGEPLKGWFWTSEEYIPDDANVAEYSANAAWYYNGYGGTLDRYGKYSTGQSRPIYPSTSIIK